MWSGGLQIVLLRKSCYNLGVFQKITKVLTTQSLPLPGMTLRGWNSRFKQHRETAMMYAFLIDLTQQETEDIEIEGG